MQLRKYKKAFLIQKMVGGDVGAGCKYTNTRLMTLSQSTCFVTWEGGLFKRITAEIHKYNVIDIQMRYNYVIVDIWYRLRHRYILEMYIWFGF